MPVVFRPHARDQILAQLKLPVAGTSLSSYAAQQLALDIAGWGSGRVAPNPLVGCVLVDREHRFVAAGAHTQLGEAHAEVAALAAAAAHDLSVAGGTAYVTLEPCAHFGRTPPCAPRLAQSGVSRVVYGTLDPNPKVSGQGAALIAQHGVTCVKDEHWEPACRVLAEIFLHNQEQKRPFVGLKAAVTLDGMLARPGDRRAWITGARARAYGHFLRVQYDAIMVGRGTVEADDPMLDARDALLLGRMPFRVVIDPDLKALRPERRMLSQAPDKVIWLARPEAWQDPRVAQTVAAFKAQGGKALAVPSDATGELPPASILAALASLGITSVLLEGGAGLYAPFLRTGLVERLHLFQAAQLWGGQGAISWTGGVAGLSLVAASDIEISTLDDDWVVEARIQPKS